MPARKNWIMLLKNKAFEDKATELKINNVDIDKVNPKEINQNTKCIFKCNCGELGNRTLRDCVERNDMYCKKCTLKNQQEKQKITNLERYGCENAFQNEEIKKKITEKVREKYGVDNVSQNEEIKQKKVDTCFMNRDCDYPFQSEQIREKSKETCQINLGCDNPSQNEKIKQKKVDTCFSNLGVSHPMQSEIVQEKSKETSLLNYGVEYPCQNFEIFIKQQKSSYLKKDYTLPSGTITQVQGYEPIALDELFMNNYKEDDIIIQYQGIDYEFEDKIHKYFPDIYIKSENKIIEVKSTWTMEKEYDKNMAKWEACVEQGYEFEFWIYDNKKNKEILRL